MLFDIGTTDQSCTTAIEQFKQQKYTF